jgi:magnesium transporter
MTQTTPSQASPSDGRRYPDPVLRPPVIDRHHPIPGGGRMRVGCWDESGYSEWEGTDDIAARLAQPGTHLWIDLSGPAADQVTHVTQALRLHPLIAEDILEGNQRSKIEVTEELIHIVVFVLRYGEEVAATEVDIVLGEGFLLTVHDVEWDPWTTHHLRDGVGPILRHGPDHMLWALVDTIVDDYFPLIDRLGDAIDDLQDTVVEDATPPTLERLFRLKRELILIRRAAAPIREIFNQLTNRDLALIDAAEILYFRDVYDHLIRLTDEVDNYRELVSGTLDVYLSTVNNNLSLIMKRLTGITVILAGIGAIAGIFGMSEAGAALAGTEARGFWLISALVVASAFAIAWYLRRIDWI